MKNCKDCRLWKTRTNIVLGSGAEDAKIVFIGEAPGRNEDLEGKPFVGRAGNVLKKLLKSINLDRDEVYITNVVKCRPPGNRKPRADELKACKKYLDEELRTINPGIICSMGNFATQYLFKRFGLEVEKISSVHGKQLTVNNLLGTKEIIPLYHPAVATYDPNMITVLKKDFRVIEEKLNTI